MISLRVLFGSVRCEMELHEEIWTRLILGWKSKSLAARLNEYLYIENGTDAVTKAFVFDSSIGSYSILN